MNDRRQDLREDEFDRDAFDDLLGAAMRSTTVPATVLPSVRRKIHHRILRRRLAVIAGAAAMLILAITLAWLLMRPSTARPPAPDRFADSAPNGSIHQATAIASAHDYIRFPRTRDVITVAQRTHNPQVHVMWVYPISSDDPNESEQTLPDPSEQEQHQQETLIERNLR